MPVGGESVVGLVVCRFCWAAGEGWCGFPADAYADEECWDEGEFREAPEQSDQLRRGSVGAAGHHGAHHAAVEKALQALDGDGRQEATAADGGEILFGRPASEERVGQQPRGGDGVLHCQVDSDAAYR